MTTKNKKKANKKTTRRMQLKELALEERDRLAAEIVQELAQGALKDAMSGAVERVLESYTFRDTASMLDDYSIGIQEDWSKRLIEAILAHARLTTLNLPELKTVLLAAYMAADERPNDEEKYVVEIFTDSIKGWA